MAAVIVYGSQLGIGLLSGAVASAVAGVIDKGLLGGAVRGAASVFASVSAACFSSALVKTAKRDEYNAAPISGIVAAVLTSLENVPRPAGDIGYSLGMLFTSMVAAAYSLRNNKESISTASSSAFGASCFTGFIAGASAVPYKLHVLGAFGGLAVNGAGTLKLAQILRENKAP
jgi:hypothetical protein